MKNPFRESQIPNLMRRRDVIQWIVNSTMAWPVAALARATSSNYALRLPAYLKRAVAEVAREDGTTLNQFIVSAVAEKLRRTAAEAWQSESAGAVSRRAQLE
jgi:post-segregation antitoxin (ccd killing protein)